MMSSTRLSDTERVSADIRAGHPTTSSMGNTMRSGRRPVWSTHRRCNRRDPMASDRRIAANRINARKSCGPRTAVGKARISRNAMRHGLASLTHRAPLIFQETEQIAKALCGADDNPLLFEQALIIAENLLLLRCVRLERIAAIERLRDCAAIPLAKGDNRMTLARAKIREAELAEAEIDKMMVQYGFSDIFHGPCDLLEQAPPGPEWRPPAQERDELAAVIEATPDLSKFDRYERR